MLLTITTMIQKTKRHVKKTAKNKNFILIFQECNFLIISDKEHLLFEIKMSDDDANYDTVCCLLMTTEV